jgi:hypothetical protein
MSVEHAKRFVDLIDSDPALQESIKTAGGDLVGLAAQRSCIVTLEELHDELRLRWGIENLDAIFGRQSQTGHWIKQSQTAHGPSEP